MTANTLVQTLVEIYGRIGDFHITPCDGAIPVSEADRLAEKAVEDYTNALKAEIERLTDLLRRVVNLAEAYATGTGTAFTDTIAEARAALEQSK